MKLRNVLLTLFRKHLQQQPGMNLQVAIEYLAPLWISMPQSLPLSVVMTPFGCRTM